MKSEDVFSLFMLIAIISFLGFAVENLWLCFTKGYMDNRNMVLPFLLGYGLAVAAIFLLFGTPSEMRLGTYVLPLESRSASVILYFVTVMVCISVGEIVLGTVVEKVCGIVWWDYSELPCHVTKYTSLFTSMGFTAIIVFFMDNIFMPLFGFFKSCNVVLLGISAVAVMVLMCIDFVRSAYLMHRDRTLLHTWRIETNRNKLYRALHKE